MAARVHFESKHTSIPSDNVTGTGTINQVAKFTGANAIGDSIITDNGTNVGIGTTIPSLKLDVEGSVNNADIGIRINNTFDDNNPASNPTSVLFLNAASNNGYLRVYGAPANTASKHQIDLGSSAGDSFLTFSPNGGEKMRIDSAGNVGIGTSSPNTTLYVNGGNANNVVTFESTDDAARIILKDDDTAGYFIAKDNVISIGGSTTIANNLNVDVTTGNVGIGTSIPVRKLDVKAGGIIESGNFTSNAWFHSEDTGSAGIRLGWNTSNQRGIISPTAIGGQGGLEFWIYDGVSSYNTQLTITHTGNVGIGTSSPDRQLTVFNSSNAELELYSGATSSGFIYFRDSGDTNIGALQYDHNGNYMAFRVNDGERIRIASSGNVGIGTSSPANKLHIQETATAAKVFINGENGTVTSSLLIGRNLRNWEIKTDTATNGYKYSLSYIGTDSPVPSIFTALASGNVGIGTSNPAVKLDVSGNNSTYIQVERTTLSSEGSLILGAETNENTIFSRGLGSANKDIRVVIGATERMRITSAGNVGIGTSSPAAPLHILKTATGINTATTMLKLSSVDTNPALYVGFQAQRDNSAGQGLNILVTNVSGTVSEAMRILPTGNVGIGTSSPSALLDIGVNNIITLDDTGSSTGFIGLGSYNDGTKNRAQGASYYGFGIEVDRPNARMSMNSYDSSGIISASNITLKSNGNVGIGTTTPTSKLQVTGLLVFANNADAVAGGLTSGAFYTNASGTLSAVL